jgi:hypothetical protein
MKYFLILAFFGLTGAINHKLILKKHNKLRSEVDPPANYMSILKWDKNLAKRAQKVANTCTFMHQDNKDIGQNLFMSHGFKSNWSFVIESWYNERDNYDYWTNGKKNPAMEILHYTQLVWDNTKKIGCGYKNCSGNNHIYVCNYFPPGNYKGVRPYEIKEKNDKKFIPITSNTVNYMTPASYNDIVVFEPEYKFEELNKIKNNTNKKILKKKPIKKKLIKKRPLKHINKSKYHKFHQYKNIYFYFY